MQKSEQINELATALCYAQGKIKGAVRDSTNPAFRSKYADLSSVLDAIREPFASHGLSIVQELSSNEEGVRCETTLMHTSGQWLTTTSPVIPVDKHSAHGVGSASSYARRYSLSAFGVAQIDDDGNAAAEAPPRVNPVANALGDWPAQHPDQMDSLRELAADLVELVGQGESKIAFLKMTEQNLDSDQKVALWSILGPNAKVRAAIKKEAEAARQ